MSVFFVQLSPFRPTLYYEHVFDTLTCTPLAKSQPRERSRVPPPTCAATHGIWPHGDRARTKAAPHKLKGASSAAIAKYPDVAPPAAPQPSASSRGWRLDWGPIRNRTCLQTTTRGKDHCISSARPGCTCLLHSLPTQQLQDLIGARLGSCLQTATLLGAHLFLHQTRRRRAEWCAMAHHAPLRCCITLCAYCSAWQRAG